MEDYTILPHLTLKFKATVFFLFTTLHMYIHIYIHIHVIHIDAHICIYN